MPFALLLIPLFAWADRIVGGAGRRSYAFGAVAVVGLGLGLWAHQPGAGILCGVWILYRSLPWKVWGTATPHGGQVLGSLARHAIPLLGAVIAALGGWGGLAAVYLLILYALAATALAATYATQIDLLHPGDDQGADHLNALQEIARGALFGACLAVSVLMSEYP